MEAALDEIVHKFRFLSDVVHLQRADNQVLDIKFGHDCQKFLVILVNRYTKKQFRSVGLSVRRYKSLEVIDHRILAAKVLCERNTSVPDSVNEHPLSVGIVAENVVQGLHKHSFHPHEQSGCAYYFQNLNDGRQGYNVRGKLEPSKHKGKDEENCARSYIGKHHSFQIHEG